ncbi:MAG: MBL fold metallo-hydrolase [Alistipes sp.]|nr:MBL fold metallo-hydrolase [Alistipes sp.]
MKLTFLGTGTSQGVPVIGCRCDVCRSADRRDRRLRTSAMVEVAGMRIIIDAGPDFRYQMLREGVTHIDAILLTHQHKDHTAGIDDVRAFNFVDYPTIHTTHIYSNSTTIARVMHEFDYAFAQNKYRGVPVIELHTIDENMPFTIGSIEVVPIVGHHSSRFRSIGYRIGDMAYITDFSHIEPAEEAKLQGVTILVINALRWKKHDSHFSVDEALEVIERIRPKRSYLTHMSHDIGLYAEAIGRLPEGVTFAYDGLVVEIEDNNK